MICTKCNSEIPNQAKFCPHCGTPAPEAVKTPRFCMYCGATVDANTQFCEHCGQRLAPPADTSAEEAAEPLDASGSSAPQAENHAPAVTQNTPPVSAPVSAPVAAAPVVSAVGTEAVRAAGHAAAPVATAVGAEVVRAAGQVATGSVRSAGRIAKRIAIWTVVVAFVLGLASACLSHFVPSPEETVDTLFSSIEELDYNAMLDCIDSKTGKQLRAIMGITGDLLGSLTGIDIDLEAFMDLAPAFGSYLEMPELGVFHAETVLYTDYSAKKIQQICMKANNGEAIDSGYISDNDIISFLNKYHLTLPGLENLLAKTAIVKVTDSTGAVGYLPMVNEGNGDWRILMEGFM